MSILSVLENEVDFTESYVTVEMAPDGCYHWRCKYHEAKSRTGTSRYLSYAEAEKAAQSVAECKGLPYTENPKLVQTTESHQSRGWLGDIGEYESRCPYLF